MSLDELAQINHIFLTHAHLDHLAAFPCLWTPWAGRASRLLHCMRWRRRLPRRCTSMILIGKSGRTFPRFPALTRRRYALSVSRLAIVPDLTAARSRRCPRIMLSLGFTLTAA
ncbi:MAG: hypothetical protein ACREV0_14675 [Burkholderiales bacterium]